MYHAKVNVNLMGKNVLQISGEIMINVRVSVKNVTHVKKTKFGIPLNRTAQMENILLVFWMIQ